MNSRVAAAAALLLSVISTSTLGSARTISEGDYKSVVALSSPAISPDGKRAVVVLTRVLWDDDTYRRELVLVDLVAHTQRVLTYDRKGLSDPEFSPDGSQLAFISEDGKGDGAHSQVWLMPFGGGDPRPITKAPEGVDAFAWRPDGNAIAYSATDAAPKHKGAARFTDSFVFTTEPITARAQPQPSHLFVMPTSGGSARQLTYGAQSIVSAISWSPDGATIAVALGPNAILNDSALSHVDLVDIATKKLRPLTSHRSWESDPLFSPDGKHILYTYSTGDNQVNPTGVYVTTPSGGEGVEVSKPFDRAVRQAAWASDSSSVLFGCGNGTAVTLVRATLDGTPHALKVGELGVTSTLNGTIAHNGSMVFVAAGPKTAPELYSRNAEGAISKVTDENAAITALTLAPSQTVSYETSLGIKGDAVLYTPPTFSAGNTYPMVVFIHGGPTSSTPRLFDFWAQVMAARGWLVLRPNYRGSDNLGRAYQRAVLYDAEAGPGKDIMAAVDAVRSRGIVDNQRIAVSGWSYGGIMTAWMISEYHIWKAAVSGASVNDWATDYGVADDSDADSALFHGSPYVAANAAEWRRASAINYAAKVTTPVLILSDVGDNRDPFATSSMYWRALRDNHKDATLRVWPINGHFPRDPVRAVDVYHYWIDFIASHFQ